MKYQLSLVLCIIAGSIQANTSTLRFYQLSRKEGQLNRPQFSLTDSISTFSIDLMKSLYRPARDNENVACSPVNVYSALALLLLGSAGTTSDEIREAMNLPTSNQLKSLNEVHTGIADLLRQMQDKNIRVGNRTVSQVTLANGIFVDNHLRIKKNYENAVSRLYNGYIQKLDFSDGYAAIEHINKWIAIKTNNQISQIFTEPLDQHSSVVEVTSVYFSGGWFERFLVSSTKQETFNTGTRTVNADMMNNKGRISYYNNPDLQFESIQLDFHGRYYSAVFILPSEQQTIAKLIESIDKPVLQAILNQTNFRGVNYKVPKMKFFASRSLKEPLQAKGLSKVFEKADLSWMLDSSAQKISDVKHAVEIEVDESGAKATAVTSVRIEPLAAKNPPEHTIDFFLNRPFIMMIQHRPSGTILFTAIVQDPLQ